jgi:hypothetical protein
MGTYILKVSTPSFFMHKHLFFFLILFKCASVFAQHEVTAQVTLHTAEKEMRVSQNLTFKNTSKDSLQVIYLNDWINAFSHKQTPLAYRFREDYQRNFHYAKASERGKTQILSIRNVDSNLNWFRPENQPDLLVIQLEKKLPPQKHISINLEYNLKIPHSKFTRYGYKDSDFILRYWLLTPAVYAKSWKVYSHKNVDDFYMAPIDLIVDFIVPENYYIFSNFKKVHVNHIAQTKNIRLSGKNLRQLDFHLTTNPDYEQFNTDLMQVFSNIEDDEVPQPFRNIIVHRILHYLNKNLGHLHQEKLLVTKTDYADNPVYGLNQLPKFIRPFPDGFQYDIKMFKTITNKILKGQLNLEPRKENWIKEALLVHLMMNYVETYYEDTKLLGAFSELIGIRWFHASELNFNKRYALLYQNMARINLDQAITTTQDSLLKFNKNIATPYKAGLGLNYLKDYLANDEAFKKSISAFYQNKQKDTLALVKLKSAFKTYTNKPIDWFFNEYIQTNLPIDFKIKKVTTKNDSLQVIVTSKNHKNLPVTVYGLNGKKIVSKHWLKIKNGEGKIHISKDAINRIALNHEQIIPEYNQRNNYKSLKGIFNKPPQVRLLMDIEDPYYKQLFLIPEFDYNLYDGFIIGPKLHNRAVLPQNFNFNISPKIGLNSNALIGSIGISSNTFFQNQELHAIRLGISGTRMSYAPDAFYYRVVPYFSLNFRNPYLRSNQRQSLSIRSVNVRKDQSLFATNQNPDYSVMNLQYNYSDRNFADYFTANFDYQVAKKFSKISITTKWRKLFLNNRQLELRVFAGAFLFNDTRNEDYFSFALDRPSDYMFDYNYYGRSETSGLFSQQFIAAEGGFKSKIQPGFANQWISTINGSFSIWNWIHAYADAGVVKNKNKDAKFLYDSGIRLSLVQDYFEVFFPLQSSLGWEPSQYNYDQKIRFIVALDLKTLVSLFKRRWY